jgi:hypothetical protein
MFNICKRSGIVLWFITAQTVHHEKLWIHNTLSHLDHLYDKKTEFLPSKTTHDNRALVICMEYNGNELYNDLNTFKIKKD